MSEFSLVDRRIVVTGASSGIGRACAILASRLGATVVLVARREEKLRETLALMTERERHRIVVCDVTDSEAVARMVVSVGEVDGLVHAAGIGPMCPIGMLNDTLIDEVLSTNYVSFVKLMKHYSKAKNRGVKFSAVAVSSVAALAGWGGVSVYSGSKGALNATVRSLAIELAPKGVRINSVCPSNIKTPMYESGAMGVNDEASLKSLIMLQPLGLGEPEQVAWPVCFLLSDAASFITGVNLPVDGGYLAR